MGKHFKDIDRRRNILNHFFTADLILSIIGLLIAIISITYLIIAFNNIQDTSVLKQHVEKVGVSYETQVKDEDITIGSSSISLFDIFNQGISTMFIISLISFIGASYNIIISILSKKLIYNWKKRTYVLILNYVAIFTSILSIAIFRTILQAIISLYILFVNMKIYPIQSIKNKLWKSKHMKI